MGGGKGGWGYSGVVVVRGWGLVIHEKYSVHLSETYSLLVIRCYFACG